MHPGAEVDYWPPVAAARSRDRFNVTTRREGVSRAFVNEDAGGGRAKRHVPLPPREDPAYDMAAAEALLEGARAGDTGSAEEATGYYWGERRLRPYVETIRAQAVAAGDERLAQLAERFLQ
jgi:hypothetical protein